MTNQIPVIEVLELSKVFDDFWGRPRVSALSGVSLKIEEGQVYGLLGPNGSGKTTTIKILLGLLYPTRGTVQVFGRSPRDVRTKARIGYLPEESYLYPFLNAEETLDFYGRLFKLPKHQRKERADSLLEMVGLNVERRRPIREYSKGMVRRIGIAQALINDPDLIILDEPTSGLDPIGSREVKDLILRLKQRGKTILLCSHLLGDVEDVCDQIAILYGGKVRKSGTVPELLTRRNVTQISAERLNEGTTEKVLNLIRDEEGEKPVTVEHPTMKLESFFLEVVNQAQQEETDTSGARMGESKSSFLTEGTVTPEPSKKDVLASLMSKPEEPEEETEEAAPQKREINRALLGDLSAPVSEELPEEDDADTEPDPDQSVLDRLVKPDDDKKED
jgi:ABC-2 type transport system ATP-binding protein